MEFFRPFLSGMLRSLPMLIVYGVGIVLAIVWWRRCPRACLLALLGLSVMLVTSVLMSALWAGIFHLTVHSGQRGAPYSTAITVLSIAGSVLPAAGFSLLLAALFTGRPRAGAAGPPQGAPPAFRAL